MTLWYKYTLNTLKGLKRAYKHVTRHIKHFTLYSVTRSQGFYTHVDRTHTHTHTHTHVDRWTRSQVTGHTQRKEDTTHIKCIMSSIGINKTLYD